MASTCLILCRSISTSCSCYGKRNFRKFPVYNKRGTRIFKETQHVKRDKEYYHSRGNREPGYRNEMNEFIPIPEMIPEIIVPSLEGFKLKPYVSYRSQRVTQSKFTPQDLFNAIYLPKMVEDFKKGNLDPNGEPLHPSENEKLTPEQARDEASKPCSDMFTKDPSKPGTYPSGYRPY